jgi:NCS1 family nucleobase:cation symporter-1
MVLFAFIGVAVTGATVILYGKAIWDPTALAAKFNSPVVIALSTFALAIATLSTNIAANVVGPANDFANLAPKHLNFRTGGLITAVIGIGMMPWKLLESSASYTFTWLLGYSALLGPIGAILIIDYFVIRGRELELPDLYRRDGAYRYWNGFNLRAIAALVLGVIPSLPGFLRALERAQGAQLEHGFADSIYESAWFVGFGVAAVVYFISMKLFPQQAARPVAATPPV